ncbi:hypothetical protein AC578_9091 [Pseudocercospora eumusae]|uniref:Zn(2)-C6 fungal-type domain-containing protein n=1 Tax=Pseudocercospora eumusae TaxID=321146 RepID=A0A139HV63_9PEZI|nr:hypothetical protein AC578_9091 [Pseudocercospora eumusae]
MFGILDAANGTSTGKPKTSADRACDQCKQRKVKCQMTKPCTNCSLKGLSCTYDKPRKKRGPAGKRIDEIRLHQRRLSHSDQDRMPLEASPSMESLSRVSIPLCATRAALSQRCSPERVVARNIADLARCAQVSPGSFDSNGHAMQNRQTWSASSTSQPDSNPFSPDSFSDMAFPRPQHGHTPQDHTKQNSHFQPTSAATLRQPPPPYASSEHSAGSIGDKSITSPNPYMLPSLPVESPSGMTDPFVAILEQELAPLAAAADAWPARVNETTLLPWIDVYFKRLHPTVPILSRNSLYSDMLQRKHRTDPQYGSMLLGLAAFAMTQPVHIHERSSIPSRSIQARMLMEECVKLRVSVSFGEDPTIEMILGSFFLFACLFGSSEHKAARHRLREAVDLACSLGLHLPNSYDGLTSEKREQWLRTYLVLSVTERAYALQQNHAISFRGQPGITARFMQAFDPRVTDEYISSLIYQDQADAVGMTGLLYLMDTFDSVNENVMECWNGFCHYSDGACETFDRRRALQTFRAQRRVREACIAGNISFAPSVTPLPLAQLVESQQADISVAQFWLLNRLWNLCLSHQLLRENSDYEELRYEFACHIAHALLAHCSRLSLAAMEVHGVGMAEKIYDVTVGIITAINATPQIHLELVLRPLEPDVIPGVMAVGHITIRALLEGLGRLIGEFRGGEHPYSSKFASAVSSLPAYQAQQG